MSPGFRQRVCPRKGCEAVYTPRTGNQRCCQDQQCLQKIRRWQAARRQKQRRLRPEVRKTQAAAAKDNTLATAMIDRLMHHGEAMVIQGSSFRTKGETPDE
ncbi:MAG: ATP-binding protein [Planctomyces sp.]